MKRSVQEIVELLVFGLIALLLGTGLLWLVGWVFDLTGGLFKFFAGLIWGLLRFIVPVALVAAIAYLLVRLLQGRGRSDRGDSTGPEGKASGSAHSTESTAPGSPSGGPATAATPSGPTVAAPEAAEQSVVEPTGDRTITPQETALTPDEPAATDLVDEEEGVERIVEERGPIPTRGPDVNDDESRGPASGEGSWSREYTPPAPEMPEDRDVTRQDAAGEEHDRPRAPFSDETAAGGASDTPRPDERTKDTDAHGSDWGYPGRGGDEDDERDRNS